MNKRIKSLLLCFVMIFSLLFTALPAFAVPGKTTTLTVTPDKATASPGETVTYTVTLGAVEDLLGIKFKLIIPEGLTFVTGAAKTGVKEALGATSAEFTPSTKVFLADPEYTSASDLDLMTFECTVDSSASGNLTVQLYIDDPENYYDSDGDNIDVQVTNATITVTAAPKPATGISLNKSTLELTVGASETLVATVTPADTTDTVTWDTGRSDVATVDSTGKVTAVAPGTAVIAARAGEKSASCTVTVVAAPCTHTNKTNVDAKTSTCKEQGWEAYSKCNDCGQLFDKDGNKISAIPYLSLADHNYTANEKKPEALKTAGTCKDKAIYLRSCEVCGEVAPSEAWGTFYGDIDQDNHTGTLSDWVKTDPDKHWKEYSCCHVKVEEGTHVYADAADITCNTCGYERTVAPTHPDKPTIAVTGTYTYNGNVQTATVTGYDPATMNISGNTGTDAGPYTVSVTSKTGQWTDGTSDAVTANWSIGKANAGCTAPTAKPGLTYNDAAQELITAGTAFGGTMKYSTNGNDWFDEIPTGTNAGSYTVHYKVIGDGNHNDNAGGSVDVTINKATPTGKPSYTPINEEGKTLDDVNLDAYDGNYSRFTYNGVGVYGTITWLDDNGNPIADEAEANTPVEKNKPYRWRFTPRDYDNFNPVEGSITPWDESGNGSIVIIVPDDDDTTTNDKENPTTGAAVSGSSIGYACAALAVVGTIYVGAKKLAKKDEE